MTDKVRIHLKKPPEMTNRIGHPWIYKSQIHKVEGKGAPGILADVLAGDRSVGIGYFNPESEICLRMLSFHAEAADKIFFKKKIAAAAAYRKQWVHGTNAFRLISSEADGLPGLIVDRYADVLVVQFLTAGMERLKSVIIEALDEAVPSKGIYERSDTASRKLEGLAPVSAWIRQDCGDEIIVHEGELKFPVRLGQGHKTGFYLDQRENRLFMRDMGIRGDVLDVFCHTGAFGLHLASMGCRVTGIESQADAVRQGEENKKVNSIGDDRLVFKTANAFDELKSLEKAGALFDLVILDPPSFVKRKDALEGALAGFKEILLRSMKILRPGAYLAAFSCSYHVDDTLLLQCALSAARDVRRDLRIVRFMKQSLDHPIHPFIPETYYLKGYLFSVSPF